MLCWEGVFKSNMRDSDWQPAESKVFREGFTNWGDFQTGCRKMNKSWQV